MTRARQHLHLLQSLRFRRTGQHRNGDSYVLEMRGRFILDRILDFLNVVPVAAAVSIFTLVTRIPDTGQWDARIKEMWD
jgi:hypothetical protein